MSVNVIKVECAYTVYLERGLRFSAAMIDEAAGHEVEQGTFVTVVDVDLAFTRHEVLERGEFVTLGPATPWPAANRGWRG